jgi:hypothetical protein
MRYSALRRYENQPPGGFHTAQSIWIEPPGGLFTQEQK